MMTMKRCTRNEEAIDAIDIRNQLAPFSLLPSSLLSDRIIHIHDQCCIKYLAKQ